MISTVLVFVYGLLLARLLTPVDLGTYEYVVAWLGLLTVVTVFGLDRLLVRYVATSVQDKRWGEVRGIVRWSNNVVLCISAVVALSAGLIVWFASGGAITSTTVVFWIGCAFLPITSLTMIQEGALRGLQHVLIGQVPILIIRPLAATLLIGGGALFTAMRPDATVAMATFVIAAFLALAMSWVLLRRSMPDSAKQVEPQYARREWAAVALPLMFIAGLNMANARIGTIFLGALGDTADVGVYAIAMRWAELVAFTIAAVNAALAPTFASLHAAGEKDRLQRLVTRSTRLVLASALPIALVLLLFGRWFLLIYGEPFLVGRTAMSVLVISQVVGNVSMGSVGYLLMMTGFERDSVLGYCFAIAANVILSYILIPKFGLLGAALATAISVLILNGLHTYFVYRRLGIHGTVLGSPRRGRG